MFLKDSFCQAENYFVLCIDIYKNYLTAHIVRKFHKFLFGFVKFLFCLEARTIDQFITLLVVSLEMSFCFVFLFLFLFLFLERDTFLEISNLLISTHLDL